jgi:hypothetical protein
MHGRSAAIMGVVGSVLWMASGGAAFMLANFIPYGRVRWSWKELAAALIAALFFGAIATALDFGGWRELDPRAAAFVFFTSMSAIAAVRIARLA